MIRITPTSTAVAPARAAYRTGSPPAIPATAAASIAAVEASSAITSWRDEPKTA